MSLSKPMESLASANSAAMGGFLATLLTFPLDTIKTKMQASSKGGTGPKFDSQTQVIQHVLKNDGVYGFFAGVEPKLIWSMFGKWCYYGFYSFFEETYKSVYNAPLSPAANMLAGYLSDFTHLPITLPFEGIATKMQTSAKGKSLVEIVRQMYEENGIGGFYKGLNTYFVLCWLPAIFNTIFTQVKNIVMKARGKPLSTPLGTVESFLLGAVARAISVTLLFPYLRAKVIIQAEAKAGRKRGAVEIIKSLLETEGFIGMYTGLGPELTRGVLSTAITLMAKERVSVLNRNILLSIVGPAAPAAVAVKK